MGLSNLLSYAKKITDKLTIGLNKIFFSEEAVVDANSWAAHETGGVSEATWDDFATAGASPTTWDDLT